MLSTLWSEGSSAYNVSFSDQVLHATFDETVPFLTAPSIEHVKLFLQWLVRGSVGLIDEKMTDVTLKNYLAVLKRAVKAHTGYQYSKEDNQILAAVRIATVHYSAHEYSFH